MNYYAILKDKKVIPVDFDQWAEADQFGSGSVNRRVAETYLNNNVRVSTVFLGINHAFDCEDESKDKNEIWFETMIFGGDHDGYCERYKTYEEAELGHQIAVDLVRTVSK